MLPMGAAPCAVATAPGARTEPGRGGRKPEHLKEWYMPKPWGRVSRAEMDVRPGGIFSIDIAIADGQ